MNNDKKYYKLCEDCLCEMLNEPGVLISQHVFHKNICSFHYKYCKKNIEEKELFEKKGRNFFIDLVEYNIFKQQIRNETINFLMEYLKNYFD